MFKRFLARLLRKPEVPIDPEIQYLRSLIKLPGLGEPDLGQLLLVLQRDLQERPENLNPALTDQRISGLMTLAVAWSFWNLRYAQGVTLNPQGYREGDPKIWEAMIHMRSMERSFLKEVQSLAPKIVTYGQVAAILSLGRAMVAWHLSLLNQRYVTVETIEKIETAKKELQSYLQKLTKDYSC